MAALLRIRMTAKLGGLLRFTSEIVVKVVFVCVTVLVLVKKSKLTEMKFVSSLLLYLIFVIITHGMRKVTLLVAYRASEAVRQMELSQKHEAEETAALEKMMQKVEANLEVTTVTMTMIIIMINNCIASYVKVQGR